MAKLLTADDIVASPRKRITVDLPVRGGSVTLEALSGGTSFWLQLKLTGLEQKDYGGIQETMVALSILDPDLKPMFPEIDLEDPASFDRGKSVIGALPYADLALLFKKAQDLSATGADDADVEAIAGN